LLLETKTRQKNVFLKNISWKKCAKILSRKKSAFHHSSSREHFFTDDANESEAICQKSFPTYLN
jgi:hypothetical protein